MTINNEYELLVREFTLSACSIQVTIQISEGKLLLSSI